MPKRENSLKDGCFCPKGGDANPSCAWEELGWEPAAGRHERERKAGIEKAVQIPHPTAGGQGRAKTTFDTAWMIHCHFKHTRNKGHTETECFGRRYNSVEMEWELGLGCTAGSWELFGLQEAVLGHLPLL